jgi:putative phosphoribosyl transferase
MAQERTSDSAGTETEVTLKTDGTILQGTLSLPQHAIGVVLFAHGSGSSRFSPRNRFVAHVLQEQGIATLLFDLLTSEEEAVDEWTAKLRFDIPLLAKRLVGATKRLLQDPRIKGLELGYFGASTGAAAALVAAAEIPGAIRAIVSRGGRPDLADEALSNVRSATLLIVGGNDEPVIAMNKQALKKLRCAEKKLVIIPRATHLFEESGALEEVAEIASKWFKQHLRFKVTPQA